MIADFKEYIVPELQRQNILKKLTVMSFKEKFDAWKIILAKEDKNFINVVEEGLTSGNLKIPGSTVDNPFHDICSVSAYLNQFGVMIAEKIKGQFHPIFDPSTETLSKEILSINDNIKHIAGYNLYNAQLAEAKALKRRIDQDKVALCILVICMFFHLTAVS